jgi:hypothetical protein
MQKLKYTGGGLVRFSLQGKVRRASKLLVRFRRKCASLAKGKQNAYCEFGDAAKRCFKDYERKFNGEGI